MLILAILFLLVLVGGALHIAVVLGFVGIGLAYIYSPFPLVRALGELAWSSSSDFVLLGVPLFIMMGELLLRSGIAESMYVALDKWVGRVPGGLMHTNVAASAMFAATSGSSVATAATIGTVAIPNMHRYSYNAPLFLGSIAAGGTLGILIPPSINTIIYGVLSETAVSDLYLASFIPGFMLAFLFSAIIFVMCVARPSLGGKSQPATMAERIGSLLYLGPPLLLFLVVVGSIYLGIATPTEAASLGLMATLALTYWRGKLTIGVLLKACEGTARTTSMVMLIVVAALFLNFVFSTIGFTDSTVRFVADLAWPPLAVLLTIIAIYLVLGCFVETLTLMISTTPIVVPIIKSLGYDKVWFGVVFIILIEAALITPPIGMNLFVVQAVRNGGPFRDVAVGIVPFLLMMLLMIALLIAIPDLALFLPRVFGNG